MHSSYLQSIINIIVLCILSNIERNGKINSNVKHNFIQIASTCRSTATLGYNCLTASYMRLKIYTNSKAIKLKAEIS